MGETTETKRTTVIAERIHFVRRGTQLWGFTEQYGAVMGTLEAMIAKMPAIASSILQGHKGVEQYLADFGRSVVEPPRPHPVHRSLALFGDVVVSRTYVDIVEAMAKGGIRRRETPPSEEPYWRALGPYSAVWYTVDGEPIGMILPMIPKSKGQGRTLAIEEDELHKDKMNMPDPIDISPYVSNGDRHVFALANLPEEVIAVLFARYSRSSTDLRLNLVNLLAEEGSIAGSHPANTFTVAAEKARAFHEKWVVGYGHASVAEHATIHLAAEGVSILAAKAIEDARLASFTEKSTRYVAFARNSYVVPPELDDAGGWYERAYRSACDDLFDTYLTLLPKVTEAVADDAEGLNVSSTAIKAQAFDLLRGLLPASTKTNLGITGNARTIANLVTKLLSSHLGEMREVGKALKAEAMTVCPTLLRHADANWYRRGLVDAVVGAIPLHAWRLGGRLSTASSVEPTVHIRRTSGAEASAIGDALLQGIGVDEPTDEAEGWDVPAWTQTASRMRNHDFEDLARAALANRGPHDPVPRAFEMANYQVVAILDYGAYRDLQRHRICSPFAGLLAPRMGFTTPAALRPEHAEVYKGAMKRAERAWRVMMDAAVAGHGAPQMPIGLASRVWQYLVPLGYNVSAMWGMNLREMIHVIELRSGRQGHPSYRRFAQGLYRELIEIHPWLDGLIRVDLADYPFARAGAK